MAIKSLQDYNQKVVDGGNTHTSYFRKASTISTNNGAWCDMSTMTGHPSPNYYASTPLVGSLLQGKNGHQNGPNQSPATKYIKRITMMSPVAANYLMMDYLKYYPFIDGDSTDEQIFDNSLTPILPRYPTGYGVQAFVVAQGSYLGGASFYISYTNESGVPDRISKLCISNTTNLSGSLISAVNASNRGYSIPLQDGDRGIRSVESFKFNSANGGIFSLVLAYEIGLVTAMEVAVPAEKDFLMDTGLGMPEIKDGAYLNFIVYSPSNLVGGLIHGSIQTVWG